VDGSNPLKAGEIHKDTKQACATQVDQDELFKATRWWSRRASGISNPLTGSFVVVFF
jgi:hypothetical protein